MNKIRVRVDKWLWAARFYKMRSLATDAAKGGHVLLNGLRCKPSKLVSIHDEVQIQKENEYFTVMVTELAEKRGSAKIAQRLYQETEQSAIDRSKIQEQRKFETLTAPSPNKRPDKRDRRKIRHFKDRI